MRSRPLATRSVVRIILKIFNEFFSICLFMNTLVDVGYEVCGKLEPKNHPILFTVVVKVH